MTVRDAPKPSNVRSRWILLMLPAILAAGALGTWYTVGQADRQMRRDLLAQARRVARGLSLEPIRSLSGGQAGLDSPQYHRLKEELALIRQADDACRSVYLMGRRADGTVLVFADSESCASEDESPPGRGNGDAGAVEAAVFDTGKPIVDGPHRERGVALVTAYVPINDLASDGFLAILGLDMHARDWNRNLLLAAGLPVMLTLILLAIFMAGRIFSARCRPGAAAGNYRLWYIESDLAVAAGLVLTVFAAQIASSREASNRAGAFAILADSEAARAAEVLRNLHDFELEGLGRFFEGSAAVTESEFLRYTKPLRKNPVIFAWGWIPAVTSADKASFEREARAGGIPEFSIWEKDAGGKRTPAADREMYYPVHRVTPVEKKESVLGYDVGSEPVRRAALEQAARLGLGTATDPLTIAQEGSQPNGMLIFLPVFHADEPGTLRGFAVAVLHMESLLQTVQEKTSVYLEFALLRRDGPPELLAAPRSDVLPRPSELAIYRPVAAFGQVFSITAHPGPEFLLSFPTRAGWVTALVGTLLTALVAALIGAPLRRRQELESVVAQRTASLQESKTRYEQLAEQSRTFTWEVDRDGLYTYVSPVVEQVLGYRREELVGKKHYYELCPEIEREALRATAASVIERKEEFRDVENPLVSQEGRILWMSSTGVPLLDAEGAVRGYRGASTDITERRKVEQDYWTLFREMLNGFALHEILCDAHGTPVDYRFLAVNPAFERLTGLRGDDIVGKTVLEVLPGTESHWIERFGKVALTGEPISFEEHADALGKTFAVAAFRPAANQFAAIVTDITERKRAEMELERLFAIAEQSRRDLLTLLEDQKQTEAERARLAAAIEQSAEVVVITDPEGTIQYVNPVFETVTGYTRLEVLGKNPRILKSGQQDEAFYRELWKTISSGETWQGRFVNRRKDGTLYTVDATISPVRDAAGRIVNYVDVKRDVTEHLRAFEERAKLEDQLRQAQKVESIGRLAGGVAHDSNNMLSVILGYGERLLERLPPGDPLQEDAKQIVESAQRSAALTRQLLAFSRRQALRPEVVDLNAIVRNLKQVLHRLIGEHIELELALGEDLYRVLADPGQIEHVIINLAVNARDAMPEGGKLIIRTANVELDEAGAQTHVGVMPGPYAMIAVSDTGCGMDRETLAQIFEPFFTTKEKGQGTGLGLSTAYGIIQQSGGHVAADSEPGQGTVLRVYLPQTLTEPKTETDLDDTQQTPGDGKQILVAEDEAALRALIERELSELGYRVHVAADGRAALLLAEEHGLKPSLLLTDVVMPGMSGTVLAERLRRTQPDLKVLYMSGYTDDFITRHGALEPGMHFLAKPFRPRELAAKIQEVLHGKSAVPPQRARRILMIDDDAAYRDLVQYFCTKQGHEFSGAESAATALQSLAAQPFDVLLVDMNLPGTDGKRILQQIRAAGYATAAIILTGDLFSVDLKSLRPLGVVHAMEKSADGNLLMQTIEALESDYDSTDLARSEDSVRG